jgi:copper transport protein
VAAVAFVIIGLTAAPAFAHATLVSSTPAQSAVLTDPPKEVTLTFNESVDASFGAVRVYDQHSKRVDHGGTTTAGRVVTLPVPSIGDGTYVVTWRVISADSHPVNGAFAFQVGTAGNAASTKVQDLVKKLSAQEGGGGDLIGSVYGATRWTVFAGLALLIGSVAFLLLAWPGGRRSTRALRLVWIGWWATAAATVVGLFVYGPYAAGLGLGDLFDGSLLGDTLGSRLGAVLLVRIAVLLAAIPFLRALRSRGDAEIEPLPRWWMGAAIIGAVVLAATPGLSGHASTGDWKALAVPSDVVHVLAMAVWLGGLFVLAVALLPTRCNDAMKVVLRRWSRIAITCVIAIVITGGFQSWRQVRSLDALRDTEYGQMLIVKLVVFSLMLVLAAFGREVVLRLTAPSDPQSDVEPEPDREPALVSGGSDDSAEPVDVEPMDDEEYEAYELRRLRRSVWGEALAGLAVLVVTALLVNAVPAKTAEAGVSGGAAVLTMKSDQVWVSLVIAPGRRGANDVHVSTLNPDGSPKDVVALTMTISVPDRGITINVPLRDLGPGHFLSPGLTIPFAATWTVTAKPVLTEFDQVTLRGSVDIRD